LLQRIFKLYKKTVHGFSNREQNICTIQKSFYSIKMVRSSHFLRVQARMLTALLFAETPAQSCKSFSAFATCQLVVYQPDQFTCGFDHCMLPFLYQQPPTNCCT